MSKRKPHVKSNVDHFKDILDERGCLQVTESNTSDVLFTFGRKETDTWIGTATSPAVIRLFRTLKDGSKRYRLYFLKHNHRLFNGKEFKVVGRNMCEFTCGFTFEDDGQTYICEGAGFYNDRFNSRLRLLRIITEGDYKPKQGALFFADKKELAKLRKGLKIVDVNDSNTVPKPKSPKRNVPSSGKSSRMRPKRKERLSSSRGQTKAWDAESPKKKQRTPPRPTKKKQRTPPQPTKKKQRTPPQPTKKKKCRPLRAKSSSPTAPTEDDPPADALTVDTALAEAVLDELSIEGLGPLDKDLNLWVFP